MRQKLVLTIIIIVSLVFIWFFVVPIVGYSSFVCEFQNSKNKASDRGIILAAGPGDMALNAEMNQLYVLSSISQNSLTDVFVIDVSKNKVTNHFKVPNYAISIAINPDTNLLYVGNLQSGSYSSSVDIIDAQSLKTLASIPVGESASDIAVDSKTNMVYVANFWSDSVSIIDGNEQKLVRTIRVGLNPTSIAINPETNKIYVTNTNAGRGVPSDNRVFVIDGDTLSIKGVINVAIRPFSIDVNPNTNTVYVGSAGAYPDGTSIISVINGTTDMLTGSIEVPGWPVALTVDKTSGKIYSINTNNHSISVIDASTNKIIANIPVNDNFDEHGILSKPNSSLVYVATMNSSSVRVLNGTSNEFIEFREEYPNQLC